MGEGQEPWFSGTFIGSPGDPMEWYLGRYSRGEIAGLLRGRYRVYLEFEEVELKNWRYITEKPEDALDSEVLPAVEACKIREIRG